MAKEADLVGRPTGTKPKVRFQNRKASLDPLADGLLKSNKKFGQSKKVTFSETPIILEQRDDLPRNYSERDTLPLIQRKVDNLGKRQSSQKIKSVKTTSKKVDIVTRTKSSRPVMPLVSLRSDSDGSGIFSRPELNSALWIAEKLQAVQLEEFDPHLSTANKLKTCKVAIQQIDQKSSNKVNVPPSEIIYKDLIPLEFNEQALLTAAAEEREGKLKAVLPVPRARNKQLNIDEFLTEDMQPEFLTLPNPGVEFPQYRQPVKAPKSSVFSLYKHRRIWENLP